MTDIWRHPAVGTTRSYVHTGNTTLDYDEWADAMARGRAFVSSGPILTLDVSGKGMGEELAAAHCRVAESNEGNNVGRAGAAVTLPRVQIIQPGTLTVEPKASGGIVDRLNVVQ